MRGALALALLGSACAGYNFGSVDDCETLCATARSCGFLPSVLGWNADGDLDLAEEDCNRRCGNSPSEDHVVGAIVTCYADGKKEPGLRWCEDAGDADYEGWSPCAQIDRCLGREAPGHQLYSAALLTVQLISPVDYEAIFVDPEDDVPDAQQQVSALYPAPDGVPGCAKDGVCDASVTGDLDCSGALCRPTSCAPALCGREFCKTLPCVGDECQTGMADGMVQDLPCDTTLCRVGMISVADVCLALGATEIGLSVREAERPAVQVVFQDKPGEVNAGCEESSKTIEGEMYKIKPGPVALVARVRGELSGQILLDLGLREAADVPDPNALLPYCVEFVGSPAVLRSGENTMVLPIADLATLKASGVDLTAMVCDE